MLEGTFYGPVIVAGDSRRSILNLLVEGRAGTLQLIPHQEENGLNEQQIRKLRDRVDQGALNN